MYLYKVDENYIQKSKLKEKSEKLLSELFAVLPEKHKKILIEYLTIQNKLYTEKEKDPYEIIYWRKANAIFKWIDTHIKKIENLEEIPITKEQLLQLKKDCEKAIEAYKKGDIETCKKIMPTQEGFFFGSTEYDEWYLKELEYTVEEIKNKIENKDHKWYIFQAWW